MRLYHIWLFYWWWFWPTEETPSVPWVYSLLVCQDQGRVSFQNMHPSKISWLALDWLVRISCVGFVFVAHFPMPCQCGSTMNFTVGMVELVFPTARANWGRLSSACSTIWQTDCFSCSLLGRGSVVPILVSLPHKSWYMCFYHFCCRRLRSQCKLPVGLTWSCHDCCHGKAIPNPFSHGDNVRQDSMGLEAPEMRAQPSESCLHLMETIPNH